MRFLFPVVSCWCLFVAATAAAQDPPEPWVRLNIVDVDPQMVDEFLAVQREFTALAKKAKTPWRSVSRTEVFGDTYRFLIATPVRTLSSFDPGGAPPERGDVAPVVVETTPSSEEAALVNRVERCVTARRSYAVRVLHDFGNPLPDGEQAGLMVINIANVFPGREQDYMDVMTTDFLPHFDEAEIHHVTGSLAFGGPGGFIHVFYVKDFAQLDQGSPVMKALGSDGAQLVNAKFAGIVARSEIWVSRLVAEASYTSLPEETDKP